jgi:hypothetical protein
MTEIYWLQRLANVAYVFNVIFTIYLFAIIVAIFAYFIWCWFNYDISDFKEQNKKILSKLKSFAIGFVIVSVITIMLPTKQDMVEIIGLGGTIDYIQNNEKAQNLPDKVVNAIDRYLETDSNKKNQ